MDPILILHGKERVRHQGWLLKRGSGYDPELDRDQAQNLLRAVVNREGRRERKRYFVLVSSMDISSLNSKHPLTEYDTTAKPRVRLLYFTRKPTIRLSDDKRRSSAKDEITNSNAYKGTIDVTNNAKVIMQPQNVIKIVVPGRSYYLRPETDLSPLEQQTTAATWQTSILNDIWALFKHDQRSDRSSRLRAVSTMMSFNSGMHLEDEVPETLQEVLQSEKYRKLFRNYCKFSLAVENLLFYEAVEEFERLAKKRKVNQRVLYREMHEVISKYVLEGSEFWVNLSGNHRQELIDRVSQLSEDQKIPSNLFKNAKDEIFNLMEKNFFRRFYREEQRRTGCFFALYKKFGLDGYKSVLSHFGPVQSDLEKVLRTYEATMVKQVEEQLKVLEESLQKAHDVALGEFKTSADAILKLYASSAFRYAILTDYKNDMNSDVITPLRNLLRGVKETLEQVADENKMAVDSIEEARSRLHEAVDHFQELVNMKNQIVALPPSQSATLGMQRKNSKESTPLEIATAFFKSATGTATAEEKLDERMRQLEITPANISERLKEQFALAKKCELQVTEVERLYESQFDEALERLEGAELKRLDKQKEILLHAVMAQKNLYNQLERDVQETVQVVERIDVDADLQSYAQSLMIDDEGSLEDTTTLENNGFEGRLVDMTI